jgi:hypothetical protein
VMGARTPPEIHGLFERAFNDKDLDAIATLYEPEHGGCAPSG